MQKLTSWGGGLGSDGAGAGDGQSQDERVGPRWLRGTVVPLFLISVCPPSAMLLYHTHVTLGGSLAALLGVIARDGLLTTVGRVWGPVMFGTPTAWAMLLVFFAVQLLFLRFLPGKLVPGPVTPMGNVPMYKDNGVLSFAATVALWFFCAYPLGLFSPSIIYDHFGELLGALNLGSMLFCLLLYLKGRYAPSSSDHGVSGNPVFDYYWGTELYPQLFGFDVKRMTNCRFGLMSWPLILLSFAAKQHELHGLSSSMTVAVVIQLVYIAKFFVWEIGYLRSLDIMHDRAGFYICWGCLVWVPAVYTSSTLYLVDHPIALGAPMAMLILLLGVGSVLMNYFADAQRQRVRATGGKTKVWGRDPVIIIGHYVTEEGVEKENLLLASGYWGLARHFHYVPEILGALFWSLPAAFGSTLHLLPFFYVIFLTALLTDRAFRDDNRCAKKYGKDWDAYRRAVPYRILPGIL